MLKTSAAGRRSDKNNVTGWKRSSGSEIVTWMHCEAIESIGTNTLKWIMSATVSVAAQCGRGMSANKPTKRSGSAIMACAMKRMEAPIESTMSVQLLHIPVTWEWNRDNGTMKRIEARIESTMSVQLLHIPVTWEDSGTQSRFHTLLIRSQYAQVVPFRADISNCTASLSLSQSATPLRLFWTCSKQASRLGASSSSWRPCPAFDPWPNRSQRPCLALHHAFIS